MPTIDDRLKELGIELPAPPKAIASYTQWVRAGSLLVVSGQISKAADGRLIAGRVGESIGADEAKEGARIAAINLLAQVKGALGDLGKIKRVVRLGGFINAVPDFKDHAAIMNGASDLVVAVLGDVGIHARTTIGVGSLPLGAAVEVEGLFEI